MKRSLFLLFSAVVVSLAVSATQFEYTSVPNDPTHTRIYTLPNGLTVYLSRNTEKPEIQTVIAVRAGSQNDPLESTGLAHYQEHIMFKGTTHYGTTDYEAEKPLLKEIDEWYEKYAQETDPELRRYIYHQIDSISYLSSTIAIASEFDKLMNIIGATGVNAFTSTDKTCYHEVIPATELEHWAMIESDRFQNLVVRGFHTELETVYEEFNMYSTMDQDKVMLAIDQLLYPNVPYRQHTVIGTAEHLKNPNLKNIKEFYHTWYRPNNVAICLSGDLDYDQAISLIDRYFGAWESSEEQPELRLYDQKPLPGHRDTVVYGKEAPELWLAWMMPNIRHKDIPALEMMSSILYNGSCGLLDIDLNNRQQVLDCGDYLMESNDFSTYYIIAQPKDKQSLEEVRSLIMTEIDKLKKGQFSDDLLSAIINNLRLSEMRSLHSNYSRAMDFVHSHIYRIPYSEMLGLTDIKAKVTKKDIMRVAEEYLTDSYVCVMKQQGEQNYAAAVDKPAITPIEMNRDHQSDFVTSIIAKPAEAMQPRFMDMDHDISTATLNNGVELLYKQNTDDEIYSLDFVLSGGYDQDPVLSLSESMMDYLGTGSLSAEEYQSALYTLASYNWLSVRANNTYIGMSGLSEMMPSSLGLLEDWVLTAQPDSKVLSELIKDRIKAHQDAKSGQDQCFSALINYGMDGAEANIHRILTPKQMKQLSAQQVLDHLRALLPRVRTITYYGPMPQEEVVDWLNTDSRLVAGADTRNAESVVRISHQQVSRSEVLLAPYKANNIYFLAYANWGEVYSPQDEAIIRLFNEYFDGSMGSIVFQEMRESRALCYASGASYMTPSYEGECNGFYTFIITQNDKMQDAMEAFDSICNTLPLSVSAFEQAKTALIKKMEKQRYVGNNVLDNYLYMRDLGWKRNYDEDIYRALQTLTMDDVVRFQQAHVAHRTYRYMILGDEKKLDLKYLKTRGTVKRLKLKDIFVY